MADEEVVVKLSLIDEMSSEIKAIRSNMETNFGAANKKLAESKGAFASLGNEIKGSFVNAIKGAVLAYAGFEVVTKVTGFLKSARLEYKESVQMQMQLRTALGYTSQALNEQADALGRKLIVDNEEITAVQIKLANYVKNEEQIKRLVPAVLDLAAATGMDMASAANMVARGISDDSEELGRFKISVDGAKGSVERIDSVILGLNAKFLNQATAVAAAKDSFDQYEVAMKNIGEKVGKVVSEAPKAWFKAWYDLGRSLAGTNILEANKAAEVKKKELETQTEITRKEAERLSNERERQKINKENSEKAKKEAEALAASPSWMVGGTVKGESPEMDIHNKEIDAKIELERKKAENIVYINTVMQDELDARAEESFKKWVKDEKEKAKIAEENRRVQIVNGISGAGQLFSAIAGANKRSAQEKKNIARVEAFINTAVAITKALPNPVAVGFAAAMGIAQQVAISNAKFATGTAYQGGGMSLVGENGPEYVNLPRGASVYNNTQTRNMTTNASMNVTIMDSSGNITETLRAQLRSGQGDQLVRDIQNRLARQI
jgi:predicted GIY-YIG superfamily endonuclease